MVRCELSGGSSTVFQRITQSTEDQKLTKNSDLADLCLETNPCGIMLLDSSAQIQYINPALAAMVGVEADQFIGHKIETIDSGLRALLQDESAIQHFSNGNEGWLHCYVEEREENGSIRYYLDITELVQLREENSRLRQQIEELAITDDLTGLANLGAFTRTLESHITRSRRYQNPLSLVIIELLDPVAPDDTLPDELILFTSHYLRDRLRWVDLIARWEQNQFIIALPETRLADCKELVSKIRQGFMEIPLPEAHKDRLLTLHFGLAEWEKGFDSRRLIKSVTQSLHEVRNAG